MQSRWDPDLDFSAIVVEYVHRGAPGDRASASGDEIGELGPAHFAVGDAMIPYHRVTCVSYGGTNVFRREPRPLAKRSRG